MSGYSGSGKTFASMLLLRQIFTLNGGLESDTFKQLSAAFTVLRSLGSAQTATNRESSRIGHFIEAQVSNGELYRTKIHCYFLDQVRLHNEHLKIQSAPWEGRFLKLYYDFGQNVIFYFYLGVENLRQIDGKFAFQCMSNCK